MCMARPEAVSRAKPGQNRPGQAGPNWGLREGFGPACHEAKPEPGCQAAAFWRANFVSPSQALSLAITQSRQEDGTKASKA